MKNSLFVSLGCLLALGVGGLVRAESTPLAVGLAMAEVSAQERILDGVVEAVNQATVSAQTSGRIKEVLFDVDDTVEKGAVLLRFRDTDQVARFDKAQAAVSEAEAKLRDSELEHKRTTDMVTNKLMAESELDRAAAGLKAAQARLKSAQAEVVQAQEQVEHTIVRAPYSGIVVKRHVEVGETASVGQALLTGLTLEKLRVNIEIPQSYVTSVRKFKTARVYLPQDEKATAQSSGLTVFPFADAISHTFRARINLSKEGSGMYPGMFVKVALKTGEETRLVVPLSAVAYRSEVAAVYVVDAKGRIAMRHVRIGRVMADKIEILAGLEAGERVALDPIKAGAELKRLQEVRS